MLFLTYQILGSAVRVSPEDEEGGQLLSGPSLHCGHLYVLPLPKVSTGLSQISRYNSYAHSSEDRLKFDDLSLFSFHFLHNLPFVTPQYQR